MEEKIRHLEMIQKVISRMASNLFFLKGWTVTLIAGLFALTAKDFNPFYMWIAYFIAIIFWILDGYFLSQERKFRSLYDEVRSQDVYKMNFSMSTAKYRGWSNSWFASIFSYTLTIFYLPIMLLMILMYYIS